MKVINTWWSWFLLVCVISALFMSWMLTKDKCYVVIALIEGEMKTARHIKSMLSEHGIEAIIDSSLSRPVSVPCSKKDESLVLLKRDAKNKGYRITFSDNDYDITYHRPATGTNN